MSTAVTHMDQATKTLYVAFELGEKEWKLAMSPNLEARPRRGHSTPGTTRASTRGADRFTALRYFRSCRYACWISSALRWASCCSSSPRCATLSGWYSLMRVL